MDNKFDIIIIGGGMTGSYAAKEFCELGYKTLLIERGPNVRHNIDYPTTNQEPWNQPLRGSLQYELIEQNPIASKCYAFREDTSHFFVKDKEHPYVQTKPFDWIRGYQVGGKSLMWARQVQRWSDYDFKGPIQDEFAIDWPLRYEDLAPYYSKVEKYIGVSGEKDGLASLPDGEFLKALELNCVEQSFKDFTNNNYHDRHVIYARCAHVTELTDEIRAQGRVLCQNRTVCERGCPYGGYFSANAALIPVAKASGNLTILPMTVVHSLIYDDATKRVTSVKVIDSKSKAVNEIQGRAFFLNASTINTNLILLNSTSYRFPNGLGNDSNTLGKYVAFHNYRARVNGTYHEQLDRMYKGRKPTNLYIPRYQNLTRRDRPYKRGFATAVYISRSYQHQTDGLGQDLLEGLDQLPPLGPWEVTALMMGETIPKETNTITLDATQKDDWGLPLPNVEVDYDENDILMMEDFYKDTEALFADFGIKDINIVDTEQAPGLDIHEMGGVRMGHDPNHSMLNGHNQMHEVANVFVTDGSCMPSVGTQNPSLTFMALTVRAVAYADQLLKNEEI